MPPRKSRLKVNDLPPGGTAASAAETEARRFLDETFGGDRGAQEWDHKRRELVAQFMDSAIARDEEILRRLGFGPGNDSAARTTTNVILTKSMKRDELGKLESTLDPSTFQTLQESILTRRLKLGEVSSDHQEHGGVHRLSLWKCLSTLLLGDEEGWKNILEVTVAHMWANQEQYDQVVRAAWATNQHTASNKSYAEYLSSLWNGRTFPLFVVLDAAAAALNIDIRVWSYRSTKEKYLFVFEAPSDPLRTLHLVRQRNQQAGDYAYYRPLALPEAHELDDDLPSQSISQALLDEEVREKKIMLRLPGRQFESIEELLQMGFIVIEDEPGYTMRLYNTGPRRYTVRRHRGHRLVDEPNSRFPIDFNLDLDDSDPNILVPDSPRLQSPRRRDIPVHDREAISGFGDGDEHVADVALPDFDLSLRNVCGRLINTLDDFRKHLREGEDEEPAQSPGHEGIEPGGNFVRYLLGSNIVDANNRLDTLFAEAFQHLRLYEQHDIAALFVGTTKAGKTTTINTISRNNLVSEEQWQRLCQRTPYDDSGPEFGGSTEDDLHYLDYNIEGDDILPVSNIADTTTRFAQVIVCSDGEVSFSLEMWPFGELLPQLERINNIFQMFKYPDDNPDDDDQENAPSDNESLDGVSTSIADRLEDWMKNDPGIAISMGVLLSLLSPNDRAISKSELEGLEELVLPPLKLETLRNLSASSTVRFRRATLAESVEALSNEYLR